MLPVSPGYTGHWSTGTGETQSNPVYDVIDSFHHFIWWTAMRRILRLLD
jgi:hypothetical protein